MYFFYGIFCTLLEVRSDATVIVSSTDFRTVVTSSAFVDKTLLLKRFLESKKNIIVTAPPKFGKSTNIDMIKTFLEIEVNELGDPKTLVDISTTPINDTENLSFFIENRVKITEHPEIMNLLGRSPVIRVDFKLNPPPTVIRCMYDAIRVCKEVIHNSYKTHEYLLFSDKLTLENKQVIRIWCDDHSYKTKIDNLFISHGLLSLSQFLYKHFNGRKVFVLVDNHDFLVTRACCDVDKDEELDRIVGLIYGIIEDTVNDNNDHVCGSLITGVSQIPRNSEFNLTNFQTFRFLQKHDYTEYFGVTRKEVDQVINKSGCYLDPKEVQLVSKHCNGYCGMRGEELFNFHSVLMVSKLRPTERHCTIEDYPPLLIETLKNPKVKGILDRLSQEGKLEVRSFSLISTSDIEVRNFLRKKCDENGESHLLSYLLNWGLITYTEKNVVIHQGLESIKIPNEVIKECLSNLHIGPYNT